MNMHFLNSTCRVCLQNNENVEMTRIFEPPSEEIEMDNGLTEKILLVTGIEFQRHEKLPSNICSNCIAFLNIAYKFRSICHNSHIFLQEYVIKASPELQNIFANDYQETPEQVSSQNEVANNNQEPEFIIPEEERNVATSKDDALKHNSNKDNAPSSFISSEALPADYYDECWLEGEDDSQTSLSALPETTIENSNKETQDSTPTSKILGISSDGAAVIEDKGLPDMPKLKEKSKGPPYICEVCGNVYDRRYALQAHVRRHRDEKPFECEICGHAFHCNFELSRHMRKHTGLKPYACEYCKRSFGDRSTLQKHERIHRNERPYVCNICGKDFTYANVLKVHQLTHTGEKAYICRLCGKRFSRAHHLRAHLETILHQNDPQTKILLQQIRREEELGKPQIFESI